MPFCGYEVTIKSISVLSLTNVQEIVHKSPKIEEKRSDVTNTQQLTPCLKISVANIKEIKLGYFELEPAYGGFIAK